MLKGLGLTAAAQRVLFADIELTVSPATITENGGARTVTVTATLADGATSSDTTVALALGGTAVRGTDYTVSPASPSITIRANQTSANLALTLTPADDRLIEGEESIVVSGTSGDLKVGRATIALTDNDAASTGIVLSVDPASLAEAAGATAVTVTAELDDGALSTETTVTLSLSGTAASGAGKDYTFTPTTLPTITIPANQVAGTAVINIDPLQDVVDEGEGEAITVGGTHSGSLTVTATNITITDDDTAGSTIALSVSPDSVDENAAGDSDGNIEITVTATLEGATTRNADTVVTLTSTPGGTATRNTDYTHTALPASITIAAEAASGSATFKVNPTDDSDLEGPETIVVSGSLSGFTVNNATLSLADDDLPVITLSLDADPVTPGNQAAVGENDGATTVTVTATRDTNENADEAMVVLALAGTAESGTGKDYTFTPTTLPTITIPANTASATGTVTVTPLQDLIAEGNETIIFGGAVGDGTTFNVTGSTLILSDDDTASTGITLAVSPASLLESASSTAVTVTARLDDGAYATDTTVALSLAGVAVSGTGKDYTFTPTTLPTITIAAGAVSGTATINIAPIDDNIDEGTGEAITVSGTHAGVTPVLTVTGTNITITDNDTASTIVSLGTSPTSVAEDGSATAITVSARLHGSVTRNADTVVAITATPAGTATRNTDYTHTTLPTSITIPAGQFKADAGSTFSITPTQDTTVEGTETIAVSGTLAGYTVNAASIDLTDDDLTVSTLTSNLGQTDATVTASFLHDHTQAFTTGAHANGYKLTSVAFDVVVPAGGSFADGLTVGIYTATANGQPGTLVGTLSDPSSGFASATRTYTANAAGTGLTLERLTTYVVVWEVDQHNSGTVTLDLADSADEDTGGTAGFSIADTSWQRAAGASAWTALTRPKQVRVTGHVVRADHDSDDDGLIEIGSARQLNAVRWDLNGDGAVDSATNAASYVAAFVPVANQCDNPSTTGTTETCSGYELTAGINLDAAPYNTGAGWVPTGAYTATFEGNNNTISGLFINRSTANTGLFGSASGTLRNVGLDAVNVTGGSSTGALVGACNTGCTVTKAWATGTVSAAGASAKVGGLVGESAGAITGSFSAVDVSGTGSGHAGFGGLVGQQTGSSVSNSLAVGSVTTAGTGGSNVGGLVGVAQTATPVISDSYSTVVVGAPAGATGVGGLVGGLTGSATVDTSYWNTVTSGQATSAGGSGLNTAQLQTPTAPGANAGDTYHGWATASWDFGTSSQYPVLKGLGLSAAAQRALFADIELTVNPATISENGGAQMVTVTATLAGGATGSDTTVALALGGTAVKDTDYTVSPASPSITIRANQTSADLTLTLTPADDRLIEGEESIVVSGTSGDLIVGRAAIALTDNDAASTAIALSVNPASLAESANSMAVTVTAELDDGALSTETTVTLNLAGTAVSGAGKDYTFTPTTLPTITIPANQASGTAVINIDPLQDVVDEGTGETITVTGTHSGSLMVTAANLTITDDDTAGTVIALSVSPTSVDEDAEGDSDGNIEITVTATLQGAKTRNADTVVAVTSTLGGSATKDTDYTHTSLPASITIGAEKASGSATFKVNPTDDSDSEGTETIVVSGSLSGYTVNSTTLNLADDDLPLITLSLDVDPGTPGNQTEVGENDGATTVTVTATRDTNRNATEARVDLSLSGTAASRARARTTPSRRPPCR